MYEGENQQELKQRAQRHRKLIKMIKNFYRTDEEVRKLQKIKTNTMMEINLRYIKSEHNRHYKFPRVEDSDSEEEEEVKMKIVNGESIYNLKQQNQVISKQIQSSHLSPDVRRVRSLERLSVEKERINRLNQRSKIHLSRKKLNSLSNNKFKLNPENARSLVKLPDIRKKQKLLTEVPFQDHSIESVVIGKKLMTEPSSRSKMQGMEKYLKKMQFEAENTKKFLKVKANCFS